MGPTESTAGKLRPPRSQPERPPAALIVDDDPVMRRAIRRTLVAKGLSVREAGSAEEALQLLEAENADLLVTDLVMPGMLGSDLAAHAVAARPGLRLLMVSGHCEQPPVPDGLDPADVAFLAKPFSNAELGESVDALRPVVGSEVSPPPRADSDDVDPADDVEERPRLDGLRARIRSALPSGRTLPEEAWQRRNRWLLRLLWLHVPALALLAALEGDGKSAAHVAAEISVPVLFASIASFADRGRTVQAAAVALGLLTCSALLVHVTDGLIEAHFHFFVVVGLLTLYEEWLLFLLAVGYVLLHHGLMSTIDPGQVFAHGGNSWMWAGIHALFVGAAGAVNVVAWRLNEEVRADHRRTAEALSRQALHDALTGLPNRRLLAARLRAVLADGGPGPAVFCMDIDEFKLVNDTHGHQAGDTLLVEMATRLGAETRSADTLARLGGDEFVLVCPEVGSESEAVQIAARLSRAVLDPFRVGNEHMSMTISIGFSLGDDDVGDPEDLLQRADLALYRAKERGRSRFEFGSSSVIADERARIAIRGRLEQALVREQLSLRFQPIVDLATGAAVAFEALVRWEDPERGTLAPAVFLPTAEASGQIVRIGRWVLGAACREVARWNAEHPGREPIGLFVNASVRELAEPGYADMVSEIVTASGIPHEQLTIEVTEAAAMETDAALAVATSLTALGVHVALDDFGAGYSSLARLASLPAACIKADRRFVSSEDTPAEVLRAIGHLAREIGMWPIAEGVETEDQLRRARSAGFLAAQGYLFARPLAAPEARALLTDAAPFRRHASELSHDGPANGRAVAVRPRWSKAAPG